MPFAYWLMGEIRPKVFVELGTHAGNSYYSFCQAVRDKGLTGRCFAVDTWKGDEQAGFYEGNVFKMVNQHNEKKYKSFSTLYRMTFDEALAQFQCQPVDLLHIDGLHTYEAVRHDFEAWLPKLAPGALVLFHDIKVTHGDFGVWKFWAELKDKYPQNFELRHSHGLGVIELPGSNREGDLVWLREGTAEKKNLLEVMSVNGESLMAKVRHKELERLASTAQTKADKPAIEKPLNLELFFAQEGEKFSEEQKISEPALCRENKTSEIRIQLQGKAARTVLWRIDLGAEACLIRIHQVEFLGKNGKRIWRLTDHSSEVGIGGSAERLNGDGFLVCSFGRDPQILLPKLTLSPGEEFYEIQITLEVLNTNDYLPFLASRYHELESQSRSALAKASASLEQKEKEVAQMQSTLFAKDKVIAQTVNIEEKIEQIRQKITAGREEGLKQLAATQQEAKHRNRLMGSRIDEIGQYAGNIHEAIVGPGSAWIPAPFSWYAMLYKMLKIKKPSWLAKGLSLSTPPPRPGFWRRLERSIRKRRKRWIARIGFDRDWYLKKYPDVAVPGIDPLDHYIEYGQKEGRKKNANDRPNGARKAVATYGDWIRLYDTLTVYERNEMKLEIKQMASPPTFSILMPVYNSKPVWLRRAIESVCHQIYPNWELCIVDDASTDPDMIQDLKEMAAKDPRISIKLRTKNGNISAASNDALSMARGEWVVFMDHDDELKEDALFWIAHGINQYPDAALIYSDEDKIDESGNRQCPHFKTQINLGLLLSYNYMCHLLAVRKKVVEQVAGFREGFEGAQDYDLILRCMEKIDTSAVVHIPRILYHWRMHPQSTASGVNIKPFAEEAGRRAITEHLKRRGTPGTVSCVPGGYRVDFEITEKPKVSIIIPTYNQELLLKKCVESLMENTDYQNYQIILVDNKTTELGAKALLKYYREKGLTVLSYESEFNYSRINNFAAQHAEGELILFLNNDIEILQKDWLEVMVRQISQPDVGAVGAKLLYPNGKLQHGGVILGVGGVAGHSHKNDRGNTEGYFSRCSLIQDMSAVTGACLLVKKRIFLNVNGFEENHLKVAFNDVDLCLRLKAEGKRIIWTPFACLIHHESASRGEETTPEEQERFASEVAFMKSRWGIKLQQDPYYSPNLTLANEQFDIAFPPRLENKWMI